MEEENLQLESYMALCPLDGRYLDISKQLSPYFSEYGLTKNRVKVEVLWLKFLIENIKDSDILNSIKEKDISKILKIYEDFSEESYLRIRQIDKITNHDVKAAEIYVGEELKKIGFDKLVSFVHIGCTSEDINNTSYGNMIKNGLNDVWIKSAESLIDVISKLAKDNSNIPMLAHTHGQPATPTTVGKEFKVYEYRLKKSLENIKNIKITAKFNGATGTYAAISVAFPKYNWEELSKKFVEEYLQLEFNPLTTQIEGHDYIAHIADGIRHFNNIVLDFDVDMWLYISMEYFKQIPVQSEVGSSTMPHKVNPIRFENSEANIDMSNAIFMALSNKLVKSRMQRDLSDSSSKRNIGLAFGYSIQAINQTISALKRIDVNKQKLSSELENRWEVLAEPIQTVLRKYGIPDAYNKLKEFTRGKNISKEAIQEFVQGLDILSPDDKQVLLNLTPEKYLGLAEKI